MFCSPPLYFLLGPGFATASPHKTLPSLLTAQPSSSSVAVPTTLRYAKNINSKSGAPRRVVVKTSPPLPISSSHGGLPSSTPEPQAYEAFPQKEQEPARQKVPALSEAQAFQKSCPHRQRLRPRSGRAPANHNPGPNTPGSSSRSRTNSGSPSTICCNPRPHSRSSGRSC